jgi:hypothetical protein
MALGLLLSFGCKPVDNFYVPVEKCQPCGKPALKNILLNKFCTLLILYL